MNAGWAPRCSGAVTTADTNKKFVQEAGLEIVSAEETQDSDGHFLWLMARKPGEKPTLEDR